MTGALPADEDLTHPLLAAVLLCLLVSLYNMTRQRRCDDRPSVHLARKPLTSDCRLTMVREGESFHPQVFMPKTKTETQKLQRRNTRLD